MKGQHLLQADHLSDLSNGGIPASGRADVVTGGEEVRCVKADAEPLWLFDSIEDFSEMANLVPEAGALPGCILERNAHRRFFRDPEDPVEGLRDALHAGVVSLAKVRSGMQNEERYAQRRGELSIS